MACRASPINRHVEDAAGSEAGKARKNLALKVIPSLPLAKMRTLQARLWVC